MPATIAVIGALDTKGDDFRFLVERIRLRGCAPLLIDFGVLGEPTIVADIARHAVAAAAGVGLAELVSRNDRRYAADAMSRGTAVLLKGLLEDHRLSGVIGMGGGTGTTIATAAMRQLPFGLPKVMVSTVASGNTEQYIGTSDIMMVPSIVDVAGVNRISRSVYSRAADALCGMVSGSTEVLTASVSERPLVAATMFGITTPCVLQAQRELEAAGIEVLVFHANGTGGRAMERLLEDGYFDGVLDITTTELADELVGGIKSAGAHRLEAAGKQGIPQVVSLGALDTVNFGAPETVPGAFAGRLFHRHTSLTTLMRTTPAESSALGRLIADKLNASTGPVVLMIPLKGVSALDVEDGPFDSKPARAALFDALRQGLDPHKVTLLEIDAHINDPKFATAAASTMSRLLQEAS